MKLKQSVSACNARIITTGISVVLKDIITIQIIQDVKKF